MSEKCRVYLDTSIYNRPFDDQTQPKIHLETQAIKAIDALHVACAEASNSDYFLTCDKRLINRCQGLMLKTINPVDFILEQET